LLHRRDRRRIERRAAALGDFDVTDRAVVFDDHGDHDFDRRRELCGFRRTFRVFSFDDRWRHDRRLREKRLRDGKR